MIFYFTGTGNSLWVAKALSEALGEPLVSIADELHKEKDGWVYPVRPDEKILFVYPVHSWGPAVSVTHFISRLTLNGYTGQSVYSISTCGDECGYTDRLIGKALEKRAISLTAAYSVIMPNNYILLPGFDVDDKDVEERKLQDAPARVAEIIEAIREHGQDALYHTGSMPGLKSYWIYPLFAHLAIGSNSFRVTDACISCGLCERICPTGTISMQAGKPVWTDTCVQCVACIHRCPVRPDEKILFVYPVHSWGPAVSVTHFISRLTLNGYTGQSVYSISTCGDECGYTDRLIGKALEKRAISLTAAYSVIMPNNYILLPGFDVDDKDVEERKLQDAPARVAEIIEAIREHGQDALYHTGSMPGLKSYWIYPLFAHLAIGSNSFRVTDACISCGLCERICPTGTISMQAGKPVWTDTCVQCVACIHRCPVRAIEYGKGTLKKGRYHHPEIK